MRQEQWNIFAVAVFSYPMIATVREIKLCDCTFRVQWDECRGRYVIRDEKGAIIGASIDKNTALGVAVREANLASRSGCRVAVFMENASGEFEKQYVANPLRQHVFYC